MGFFSLFAKKVTIQSNVPSTAVTVPESAKPVVARRKQRIEYIEKELNIGRTIVTYELTDGRTIDSYAYGEYSQGHNDGRDGDLTSKYDFQREPSEPSLYSQLRTSLVVAQESVRFISDGSVTIADDWKNAKFSINGVVRKATVGTTEDFMEKHLVPTLVDNV